MKVVAAIALLASAPCGAAAADASLGPGVAPVTPASPALRAIAPLDAPPLAPAPAPLAPSTRVYLALRGGVYRPSGDAGFDEQGLDLELTVGVPLTRHLALEGGVGRYASGTPRRPVRVGSGPDDPTAQREQRVAVAPITAGVRATAHAARFAFSFLAGAGIHVATVETTVSSPIAGSSRLGSAGSRAFGVHVGGGIALAMTGRLSLGVEIRRTFVAAVSIDESTPSTNRQYEIDLDGVRGGATLAFRM